MEDPQETGVGGAARIMAVMRVLAMHQASASRVKDVAEQAGLTQATTHRVLQSLVKEGMVEQDARTKRYRLGIEFFVLAAQAGNVNGLRQLCRPVLLRLGARLNDAIFLLVRSGFDAICLDRNEGPYAIRTFTGGVGGRVPLGVGQAAMAILAFLPEAEREAVLQFNLPRLREFGVHDEVSLRSEVELIRECGYASRRTGLLEGMAGVAVPILDREGRAVAALGVGTLIERLSPDRLPIVVDLMKREAATVTQQINPFDPTLWNPAAELANR
ncbi:IclR family transcriptional regulator [Cupriavidus plantarum]|uniref:IclR family transcriptional regulator n=1 Tax=Cupriavidus plantarum TaxID=942865 RepID=A0A316EQY8_9BURK|nr:IclR family transcriptional regulator [Cupriavidus plantarum]NYI02513.1 DNA-binding IclR family transcriptional regulator [Cupriavidus plantarum]PWK33393.1 IclR family transcriptional regulator [Cupriavidus plantarum]REE87671.1 IclR family transcriptional regulator [Cupriavidus plantarum]RLK30105.1 IclR family transcriptional regulator [Cupriavidus plantarum]CAG2145251.1 HTH-type transcriptional regulator KipR [Cupriavidus plantarum]